MNGNNAPGGAGGGIANHGLLTLSNSQVDNNAAPNDIAADVGFGAGIANFDAGAPNSGVLTATNSEIKGNSTTGAGAA